MPVTATAAPRKYDPGSTTEPESDELMTPIVSTALTTIAPCNYDAGSTTKPESDEDKPAATTVTPTASTLKQKSFLQLQVHLALILSTGSMSCGRKMQHGMTGWGQMIGFMLLVR